MRPYDPASMTVPGPWHRSLAQGQDLLQWPAQEALDAYALAQHLATFAARGIKLGGLCPAQLGRDLGVSEDAASAALTLVGGLVLNGELRLPFDLITELKHY